MLTGNKNIVQTTGLLVTAASFFCVLFGQGAHLHDLGIHISSHFDIHVHIHAHESHDEPYRADSDQENHQHEVRTASDIIGTLTSSLKLKSDLKSDAVLSFDAGFNPANRELNDTPTLYDLPPPRPASSQYYLSSYSHRGPPLA